MFPGSAVLVNNSNLALMHMPYKLVLICFTNFTFPDIMKSIGFRMMHFLILCPSLSRLALRTVCTAVKIEMVGLSLTTGCYIFLKFYLRFFLRKVFCM